MCALLDLMHENEEEVQKIAAGGASVLLQARRYLTILDPEVGEEEPIKAVEAEVARLRAHTRSV